MRLLFCFLLFVGLSAFGQQRLGLNDITHLFPLPKMDEVSLMWHARTASTRGELLPYSYFQQLPRLVSGLDSVKLYQQSLKVVAVRLDPCFMETALRGCQPQIRLVWQPLVVKEYTSATIDASVHTFYDLTSNDWQGLIQEYRQLKSSVRYRNLDPLQVSPALLSLGYQSQYWKAFSSIVLKYVGVQNLVRVTFMNVNPMGNAWAFGAYKPVNGKLEIQPIPGIDKKAQVVISKQSVGAETLLDAVPRPSNQDHFFRFLNDSQTAKRIFPPEHIQSAARTAFEFENTRIHNSGTISCASCHLTRSVSLLARGSFPQWDWKQILKGVAYLGTSNMTNTTASFIHGESLRMLGYFGRQPVISDRVINDTDLALRMIK